MIAKMHPAIPFTFEPSAIEYEEHHLQYEPAVKGKRITWPLIDNSLFVPEYKYYPDLDKIEEANGALFRTYGKYVFSFGRYHEIFVGELPLAIAFKFGSTEISFGEPSPLAAFLFDANYRSKYMGDWSALFSARIIGPTLDEAEAAFINGCIRYEEKTGHKSPSPLAMEDISYLFDDFEETAAESRLYGYGPFVSDIEPLRFFYHGNSQADDVSASIYFYKVLEYYSFFHHQKTLTKMRHDTTLSESEFAKKTLELLTREEKGPILKLVVDIADKSLVEEARANGIMSDGSAHQLGEAIYKFRNSIVHGKFSHGYELNSSPVFVERELSGAWRVLMRKMALKAIETFGNKTV